MSSLSDRSEGSQCSWWGRQCGETGAHMKINLSIFKDEDTKEPVTYQCQRWDLTVYHFVGCRDCTLLPHAIRSLQGYSGELVQTSGMDITLDDMLTILDEHYNNVKALDVLNQELFQLWMADKETVLDWSIHLSRHLQFLAASFPDCFPPAMWLSWSKTTFNAGYPNALKQWWPILRPAHKKRLILITFGLWGMQRRKTPWSYPKALKTKQWITPLNPELQIFPLMEAQGEPAST